MSEEEKNLSPGLVSNILTIDCLIDCRSFLSDISCVIEFRDKSTSKSENV